MWDGEIAVGLVSSVTILVLEATPAVDLEAFVSRLSSVFEDCALTERESSNYAHGHYFKGAIGDSKVVAYYLDSEGLEQYQFAIEIMGAQEKAAHKIAQTMAKAGFSCFVPSGTWSKKSWSGEGTAYEQA